MPTIEISPLVKKPPRHFSDLSPDNRAIAVAELGEPAFRAKQLANHYFGRHNETPQEWSDISSESANKLAAGLFPTLLTKVRSVTCDGGTTRKDLWKLHDGVMVESVLMRYPDRATLCISSQAGCGMGCPFCATGQAGLTRNLSAGEITAQVFAASRAMELGEMGAPMRLSNIVFMGMGEPLANYNAVMRTIKNITAPTPDGFGISARSVTLSTVGLVSGIEKLMEEGIPVTLAVSLHTPDDELRDTLVPINTRWKVREVLAAADNYATQTGRRYSIEYAMIRDINDHAWRADLLGRMLKSRAAHVNLIPLNPTPGSKWTASKPEDEKKFVEVLESYGVPVTVRDTRGREIDGACGQLAAAEKVSKRNKFKVLSTES